MEAPITKRIELFVLRAPGTGFKKTVLTVRDLLLDIERPDGLIGVELFIHKTIPGDLAVLLLWADKKQEDVALDNRMLSELSSLGMVSHNEWIAVS